jgi:hypothetical protein
MKDYIMKEEFKYQFIFDRELTDDEKITIRDMIKGEFLIGMKPIIVSDWRKELSVYAKSVYASGLPCNYQSLGINYASLGIRYKDKK